MAPLVVPGVCRFSVHQSLGGQAVVNIVDMQVDTTGSEVGRADALFEVAGDILNNWDDHLLSLAVNELVAEEVRWLDLDSLTGPTGSRSSTDANVWPKEGGDITASVMPGMVAMRVDKRTTGGRGTKQGRMYLAGLNEVQTASGVALSWEPATVSGYNAALASFLSGINDQDIGGVPLAVQRQMVVVHGSTSTYSDVESLQVNPLISTQVRRGALR